MKHCKISPHAINVLFLFLYIHFFACQNIKSEKQIAVNGSDNVPATKISWIDTIINFGSLNYGEVKQIKFRFKNVGENPLIVESAQPSCGCTVADYTKQPILPGNTGEITAQFDTKKAHYGQVNKSIMVVTNTPPNRSQYVFFRGMVQGVPNNDKIVTPNPNKIKQ